MVEEGKKEKKNNAKLFIRPETSPNIQSPYSDIFLGISLIYD